MKQHPMPPNFVPTVCAFIRAGAFPHAAAEAAGVPRDEFEKWLGYGTPNRRKKGWRPHKTFTPLWRAVMEAKAQARIRAEMKTFEEDPGRWLTQGPGKDKPNDPGWSRVVRPVVNETNAQVNVLLDPGMQGLFASILQILAPFPDARAAIADALAGSRPRLIVNPKTVPGEPGT
jgi:hypothetical protein